MYWGDTHTQDGLYINFAFGSNTDPYTINTKKESGKISVEAHTKTDWKECYVTFDIENIDGKMENSVITNMKAKLYYYTQEYPNMFYAGFECTNIPCESIKGNGYRYSNKVSSGFKITSFNETIQFQPENVVLDNKADHSIDVSFSIK